MFGICQEMSWQHLNQPQGWIGVIYIYISLSLSRWKRAFFCCGKRAIRYRLNEKFRDYLHQIVVRFTGPRSGVNNWSGRSGSRPTARRPAKRIVCVYKGVAVEQ